MADLAKLFAKKATPNDAPTPTGNHDGQSESERVEGTPATTQAATPQSANPFAGRGSSGQSGSGGQSGGGTPASGDSDSVGEQPRPGLASVFNSAKSRPEHSDSSGVAASPVVSLDALNESTDEGTKPRPSVSYFSDETPAQKPTRELPEDLTREQLGFLDSLDSIYNIMHDPELLGGVIKNIMIELQQNPEYTKLMSPEDIRAMVRGMRDSMGLARVKKQESKAKRGSGGGRKSKVLDADMLADLDSLGLSE